MKKVFYVDPMSYSNLGEYDNALLSELYNHRRIQISFYCSNKFQYLGNKTNSYEMLPIYQYGKYRNSITRAFSYLRSSLVLLIDVWNQKPDVIHFQWCKLLFLDVFILYLLKLVSGGGQLVFTAHNIFPHDASVVDLLSYKLLYRLFTKVIVHDSKSKNKLSTIIDHVRIHVISHGWIYRKVGFKQYLNQEKAQRVKRDGASIGLLGAAHGYKNYDFALSALKNLDNIRNFVITDVALHNRWKNGSVRLKLVENVKSDDHFLETLDSCDILVLPYVEISQSGIFVTSLGRRIPCVVSNEGAPPVIVNRYGIGEVVTEMTTESLKQKIDIAIEKVIAGEYWKKFVECSECIESEFSWQRIAVATIQAYESDY